MQREDKPENTYFLDAKEGDVVRLPWGTVGTIVHTDILNGGNTKEVRVKADAPWYWRLYLALTGKRYFYDRDINMLELIQAGERS